MDLDFILSGLFLGMDLDMILKFEIDVCWFGLIVFVGA